MFFRSKRSADPYDPLSELDFPIGQESLHLRIAGQAGLSAKTGAF
jgi:hypothetical protein